MKIYISGPMTGIHEFNYPAFNEAARLLRERGYDVVNPADNGVPRDAAWSDHMRADIIELMKCDAMAMLPGWERSVGAKIETDLGFVLGMDIMPVNEWLKWRSV
jgi:hypothetical protein